MYPRRSPTTHTEQLGDEVSVYDAARAQVHALNPTAARVWRQCDGATSPEAIAAVLRVEMGIPKAEAVVDLTLTQLARVHLLELPVESRGDRSAPTRRWLLSRGLAAAMLPAILLDRGALSRGSAVGAAADWFHAACVHGRRADLHGASGRDDADGDRGGCTRRGRRGWGVPWRHGRKRDSDAYRRRPG